MVLRGSASVRNYDLYLGIGLFLASVTTTRTASLPITHRRRHLNLETVSDHRFRLTYLLMDHDDVPVLCPGSDHRWESPVAYLGAGGDEVGRRVGTYPINLYSGTRVWVITWCWMVACMANKLKSSLLVQYTRHSIPPFLKGTLDRQDADH
ncbi:hypothetical protein F5B22DRAFT_98697 [Xylaria bambusicola]|uniref:uncharacterized protein n=1 Tax=Xylaria bambusicola TaxID=326684 RepID=UPI0020087E7A|nr:uncharacterized protein F5B22DRAFT_98697 [Xylaria bambusicola]KAI0517759.1 hypothetical protein F5B22DRAFT_98697 [Xylaria bambusicola]